MSGTVFRHQSGTLISTHFWKTWCTYFSVTLTSHSCDNLWLEVFERQKKFATLFTTKASRLCAFIMSQTRLSDMNLPSVTYESAHCNYLNIKKLLSRDRRDIWKLWLQRGLNPLPLNLWTNIQPFGQIIEFD